MKSRIAYLAQVQNIDASGIKDVQYYLRIITFTNWFLLENRNLFKVYAKRNKTLEHSLYLAAERYFTSIPDQASTS